MSRPALTRERILQYQHSCVLHNSPSTISLSFSYLQKLVSCFSLSCTYAPGLSVYLCCTYIHTTNKGHFHIKPTTSVSDAGSMAREIDDLILLDSIVRMPNITTTGHGMIPEPVSCAAPITNIDLNGTRIGLPSTFGWVTGLSGEVWFMKAGWLRNQM